MTIEAIIDVTKATNVPNYAHRRRARIEAQTPMRVALGGGGTDLPWYALKKNGGAGQGGAWISVGIDRYLSARLNMTEDPDFFRVSYGEERPQQGRYDEVEIKNPYIKACVERVGCNAGIELNVFSEASGKSGLGGSAALEVSVLHVLHTYKREHKNQIELAKEAYEIEAEILGKPVGPHDQYIVALGGIQYFELSPSGEIVVEDLGRYLSRETVGRLGTRLLYFATGIQRDAADVLMDQKIATTQSGPETFAKMIHAYDQIKALGQDVRRWLLQGHLDEFGESLNTHWEIKKGLSRLISTAKIDECYEAAKKAGALGGKILGAGNGGWLMFYVKEEHQEIFRRKMTQLGLKERDVSFDWEGTKVILNIS